jgi:hypothetical protein
LCAGSPSRQFLREFEYGRATVLILFAQSQACAFYVSIRDASDSHHVRGWKPVKQEPTFTFDPGVLGRLLHSTILAKTSEL